MLPPASLRPLRRDISFLEQRYAQLGALSEIEQVRFPFRCLAAAITIDAPPRWDGGTSIAQPIPRNRRNPFTE